MSQRNADVSASLLGSAAFAAAEQRSAAAALPQPGWLGRVAVTLTKVAHGLSVAVRVVIILVLITAFCAELGWLVGWTAGEVARIAMTRDPTTIGADFGQAFGQQLQLPGLLERTARQWLHGA